MSNTVIKVEGLSKRYQLGTIGYGSLQHDLKAWWARVTGKEDPFTRIGEKSRHDLHGEFWALKNVDFEVEKGDRVGIIGRNGAGKSTLLKLLSRVTSPTTGSIKVRGRIASLLEVGTGFHPELTGRENVYLNGAILGMKRREIQAKFDEIVEFAGVSQFIDTPVKRYSSGMYVRLAFSVAAHLDSEILIVDEVLAVGDAEFQKKCLGKMEDVSSNQGKTVLFVSHTMSLLQQLCNKGVFLSSGATGGVGSFGDCLSAYTNAGFERSGSILSHAIPENAALEVLAMSVNGETSDRRFLVAGQKLNFEIELLVKESLRFAPEVYLKNSRGQNVGYYSYEYLTERTFQATPGSMSVQFSFEFPASLMGGVYYLDLILTQRGHEGFLAAVDCLRLDVQGYTNGSGKTFSEGSNVSLVLLS
jgi:lipopolysaccharide transport system ATP-binding protein